VHYQFHQSRLWYGRISHNLRAKLGIAFAGICTQEAGMQDAEMGKLQRVTLWQEEEDETDLRNNREQQNEYSRPIPGIRS